MKSQRALFVLIAVFAIGILVLPRKAAAQESAKDREPGGEATITATASATVKAIDPEKRTVTLETPDGDSVVVKCGKEARNFDQIKVGDRVKAAAIERVAVSLGKAGSPSASEGAIIARAPNGAKPGVIIANTEELTEKIDSVDTDKQTVTVEGIDGKKQTIKVSADVDLSGVRKGDDVVVSVTKGAALWVEKPLDSAQPAAGTIKPDAGGVAALDVATATATVEAVDSANRTVTLKAPDGATRTIHLGKEAINFDQIKVGDQVRATLAEEVAIAVSKGGPPPSAGAQTIIARAPKGSKPNVVIAESAQVTGKIKSIDADKRTITLAELDGSDRTLKAGSKVDLSQLKAGDDITLQVTQALAIVVETP